MEVKLTDVKGTWEDVANKARTTVNKGELGKEPSPKFKRGILRAEHSPIRTRIFNFAMKIKSWIATHFARHHIGVEKYISTQRDDRTGISRDDKPQGTEVIMQLEANTQALINMSRKRLCNQAHPETKEVMQAMKDEVEKVDPYTAEVMVPECVYRGFCPEMKSCGFDKTPKFTKDVKKYREPEEEER